MYFKNQHWDFHLFITLESNRPVYKHATLLTCKSYAVVHAPGMNVKEVQPQ